MYAQSKDDAEVAAMRHSRTARWPFAHRISSNQQTKSPCRAYLQGLDHYCFQRNARSK